MSLSLVFLAPVVVFAFVANDFVAVDLLLVLVVFFAVVGFEDATYAVAKLAFASVTTGLGFEAR